MYERLIEHWLDSATERSYQGPFCQMLVGKGHRIIHSTSHASMELGKDVISVDRQGIVHIYQLKGKPGGRFKLTDLRGIQDQLQQMMATALGGRGGKAVARAGKRYYLVVNAPVDEHASLAIDLMNQKNLEDGHPERQVHVIDRGQLLEMAQGLGADLWPSELETQQLLLGALSRDGKLGIEKESLHLLLSSILCLSDAKSHIGAREVTRRFSSAAIAVALFNAAQERELNHYALLESWVQYVAYGIGMALRNGCGYRHISCSIDLAKAQIYSALVALAEEAGERPNLLQGNMLTDIFVQRARCTLMAGLMSVYWFWSEREGWPDGMSRRTSVMRLLDNIESRLYLWGEGAIPQLLLYYWYMRETRPHASVDRLLYLLLASLAVKGRAGEVQGVPGPYWTYEDICRHEMAGFLGLYDDPLKREFHGGTTFYGEGLLSLLARTGRKEACRNVYPALTERMSGYVLPGAKWRFVLWRDEKARRISYAFDQPKKWSVLVEQAQRISCDHVPSALSRDRELFALFLLIFPWRASPDVLRALAWKYDKTWFLPGSPPR